MVDSEAKRDEEAQQTFEDEVRSAVANGNETKIRGLLLRAGKRGRFTRILQEKLDEIEEKRKDNSHRR